MTIWEEDSEAVHESFMIDNQKKRIHKERTEKVPLKMLTEAQN